MRYLFSAKFSDITNWRYLFIRIPPSNKRKKAHYLNCLFSQLSSAPNIDILGHQNSDQPSYVCRNIYPFFSDTLLKNHEVKDQDAYWPAPNIDILGHQNSDNQAMVVGIYTLFFKYFARNREANDDDAFLLLKKRTNQWRCLRGS